MRVGSANPLKTASRSSTVVGVFRAVLSGALVVVFVDTNRIWLGAYDCQFFLPALSFASARTSS